MLIWTAWVLFKIVATMMAPCSVKAHGGNVGSQCFWERVTNCDRFRARVSAQVRRNVKSSGKRSALRLTAWLSASVNGH